MTKFIECTDDTALDLTTGVAWPRLDVEDGDGLETHVLSHPGRSRVPRLNIVGNYRDHLDGGEFPLPTYGERVVELHDCLATGESSIYLTKSGAFHPQLTTETERILEEYTTPWLLGWDDTSMLTAGVGPEPSMRLAGAISLLGPYSQQWGHWCVDYLARALAIDDLPGVPVLVSDQLPANSVELLELLVRGREIVRVRAGESVRVATAFIPLPRTFCPAGWTPELPLLYEFGGWWVDESAVRAIRAVPELVSPGNATSGERVYLARGDMRRALSNEREVVDLLRSRGFEVWFPGQAPLTDLVSALGRARIVVSTWSSALHNLMFSEVPEAGRDVVIMCDSHLRHLRGEVGVMLSESGNNVTVVTGEPDGELGSTPFERGQVDFRISTQRLDSALSGLS